MNYERALLLHQLLKDYQDVAESLKFLREYTANGQIQPASIHTPAEGHRSRATGWFNRVYLLYRAGLLSPDDVLLVASPRAAQLWRDHVAPLDRAVRASAQEPMPEGAVHSVEGFWNTYADGRLLVRTEGEA